MKNILLIDFNYPESSYESLYFMKLNDILNKNNQVYRAYYNKEYGTVFETIKDIIQMIETKEIEEIMVIDGIESGFVIGMLRERYHLSYSLVIPQLPHSIISMREDGIKSFLEEYYELFDNIYLMEKDKEQLQETYFLDRKECSYELCSEEVIPDERQIVLAMARDWDHAGMIYDETYTSSEGEKEFNYVSYYGIQEDSMEVRPKEIFGYKKGRLVGTPESLLKIRDDVVTIAIWSMLGYCPVILEQGYKELSRYGEFKAKEFGKKWFIITQSKIKVYCLSR